MTSRIRGSTATKKMASCRKRWRRDRAARATSQITGTVIPCSRLEVKPCWCLRSRSHGVGTEEWPRRWKENPKYTLLWLLTHKCLSHQVQPLSKVTREASFGIRDRLGDRITVLYFGQKLVLTTIPYRLDTRNSLHLLTPLQAREQSLSSSPSLCGVSSSCPNAWTVVDDATYMVLRACAPFASFYALQGRATCVLRIRTVRKEFMTVPQFLLHPDISPHMVELGSTRQVKQLQQALWSLQYLPSLHNRPCLPSRPLIAYSNGRKTHYERACQDICNTDVFLPLAKSFCPYQTNSVREGGIKALRHTPPYSVDLCYAIEHLVKQTIRRGVDLEMDHNLDHLLITIALDTRSSKQAGSKPEMEVRRRAIIGSGVRGWSWGRSN